MPIAFISYAKEDAFHARRLYASLQSQDVTVWFDEESLLPGQNWRHSIQTAIAECRYFIALLSSKSVSKKGFVQKELKIALDILDHHPSGEVYIIPVRLEDCDVADPKLKEYIMLTFSRTMNSDSRDCLEQSEKPQPKR